MNELADSPSPAGRDAAALYLDMMKRCLTDSIFIDDPFAQMRLFRGDAGLSRWQRMVVALARRVLAPVGIELAQRYRYPGSSTFENRSVEEMRRRRAHGLDWPMRGHTMIGLKRLDNLQWCAETVLRERVPGDFIETGVWRGGACIFMRAILAAHGDAVRTVWVADSFAGLPAPDEARYPADRGDPFHAYRELAIPRAQVAENFRRYGLLDDRVRFLEGWFKDTLPTVPIEQLAVLRLDGDMYESTIEALDALYPKLSPGGFVIVDDYGVLENCRAAVHDYRGRHGITAEIVAIDDSGVYWRRTLPTEDAA